jgi:hypothetical protein
MKPIFSILILFVVTRAGAQLAITVLPIKTGGQKAVVPLVLNNGFTQRVETARATVFVLDDQGKMIGEGTHVVIGGLSPSRTHDAPAKLEPGLEPGATNTFNFVITAKQPITTTNLTATVHFSRIALKDGKLADPNKDVQIRTTK